jgi:hypothetical protein
LDGAEQRLLHDQRVRGLIAPLLHLTILVWRCAARWETIRAAAVVDHREVAVSINGEALLWGALIFAMASLFVGAPLLAKFYLRQPPQKQDEESEA